DRVVAETGTTGPRFDHLPFTTAGEHAGGPAGDGKCERAHESSPPGPRDAREPCEQPLVAGLLGGAGARGAGTRRAGPPSHPPTPVAAHGRQPSGGAGCLSLQGRIRGVAVGVLDYTRLHAVELQAVSGQKLSVLGQLTWLPEAIRSRGLIVR